jgi:RNA polymerase primary sigma factor
MTTLETITETSRGMAFRDHPSFHTPEGRKAYENPNFLDGIPMPVWASDYEEPKMKRAVLSQGEEAKLFLFYNYAKYQTETHSKKRDLANMTYWENVASEVCDRIAKTNLALVIAMAKRTRIPNVEFDELISEGNFALFRAVEKFDVSRGFKFSTYACRAILRSYNRMAKKAGRRHERFPTSYDPDLEKSDEDEQRHERQYEMVLSDLQDALRTNSAGLSDIEKRIIEERFSLGKPDKKPGTLREVGKIVCLTQERVRQIQDEGLRKLRYYLAGEPKSEEPKIEEPAREKPPRDMYDRLQIETDEYGLVTEREFILSSLIEGENPSQVVREIAHYWGSQRTEREIQDDFRRWMRRLKLTKR